MGKKTDGFITLLITAAFFGTWTFIQPAVFNYFQPESDFQAWGFHVFAAGFVVALSWAVSRLVNRRRHRGAEALT